MGQVEIEQSGDGAVTFWLHNPGKRNALDDAMLGTLVQGIRHHAAQAHCRLIALRGREGDFCVGRDVANLQRDPGATGGPVDAMAQVRPAHLLAETLRQCQVPTVAVVSGLAVGLGMGLVVWCDLAIAERQARFSVPEARLGIPPSMIAMSMVRLIGARATADLTLRARTIGTEEAARIGLLGKVCDGEAGLSAEVAAMAADILKCSPAALRSSKALMREIADQPFAAAFDRATAVAAGSLGSPDAVEGMDAFRGKRPPRWAVRPNADERTGP